MWELITMTLCCVLGVRVRSIGGAPPYTPDWLFGRVPFHRWTGGERHPPCPPPARPMADPPIEAYSYSLPRLGKLLRDVVNDKGRKFSWPYNENNASSQKKPAESDHPTRTCAFRALPAPRNHCQMTGGRLVSDDPSTQLCSTQFR